MDERYMPYSAYNHRMPPQHFHQYQSPYPPQSYPQTQLTPYDIFSKPPQPLNLMQSSQNIAQQAGPGILRAIMDANGQVDFDKTMATINQLASTYHQVSPIVRQVSALLKGFR